jgi:hypothetical protein
MAIDPGRAQQQPLPLVELGPRGHYRLPALAQIRGAAFPPGEVLTRLHLVLETGHQLDMPLTRVLAEELRNSLTAILEG